MARHGGAGVARNQTRRASERFTAHIGGMGRHACFYIALLTLLLCACVHGRTQVKPEVWTLARSASEVVHKAISETAPRWNAYVQTRLAYCKSQNIPSAETAERRRCLGHAAHAREVAEALKVIVQIQQSLQPLLEATDPDVDQLNSLHLRLLAALPDIFRPWLLAGNGVCQGSCAYAAALWP